MMCYENRTNTLASDMVLVVVLIVTLTVAILPP